MSTSAPARITAITLLTIIATLGAACSDDGPPESTATSTAGEAVTESTELDDSSAGSGEASGFIDETAWQNRVDDYISFATSEPLEAGTEYSPNRVLASVLRAERDDGYEWDTSVVDVDTFASSFQKLDEWRDTGDFDLLYLTNLLNEGEDVLSEEVVAAIEERMLAFRYWFDDPLPDDRLDHKWFWSENHRIIFATIEYLAGQRFPDATFEVTGLTGAEHAARARARIVEWIAERATYGFSEWHSNVYMQKNIAPLATLIQWAEDDEIVALATTALDLALLDVGSHLQDGGYGATHGRSYQKDSYSARAEDTFGLAKLVFDDTDDPYQSTSDAGATTLAMLDRYRVPAVIGAIASSDEVTVDRERHGVVLDPLAPISDDPPHPADHPFDDVAFWWSQGALITWQEVPTTLSLAEEYRLWETDLFRSFASLRDLTGGDPEVAQGLASQFAPWAAFALMGEAHTYTWRSPDAMLSTVVNYRPGQRRDQARAWQATIDGDAQVFTTHPGNSPYEGTDFEDADQYWTGSASMPFSVQHENVGVHVYDPAYEPPGPPLDEFAGALDETHAWFPTEHFDEVKQIDNWTFGRKDDGYIALWSMRPTQWRSHDPEVTPTGGLTEDFDLVAAGGSDNVWIVEIGNAEDGSFDTWTETIARTEVQTGTGKALYPVRYDSPSVGTVEIGKDGSTTVDGEPYEVGGHERLAAPWGSWDGEGPLELDYGDSSLTIDLTTGERSVG